MKWNNIIKVKISPKNIENNCNNMVEYLENKYGENFIKEESLIGTNNGESVFLVRTFRKINDKDLLILKDILGKDYISATTSADTFHFD